MSQPLLIILSAAALLMAGCTNTAATDDGDNSGAAKITTPVTVSTGSTGTLKDSLILPAVSIYLLSADIKTNINGYINQVDFNLGDAVTKGQLLFELETKEAKSLGNTIDKLDSSFKFSGISRIKSSTSGYITMLNHQKGDYVQDGEILASITDKNSFGFILNLPFENRALVHLHQKVDIQLPDGSRLTGTVTRFMPQMDSASQTQQVFLKISGGNTQLNVPSGLIANVVLTRELATCFTLPKGCVFADDSQDSFWVMQLINDSTAVKIPVKKGLENNQRVLILSPSFSAQDRFILEGGYGLTDTAKVELQR
ncbi:HlyD family secretion protein [Arachidicoccus rhizosphaerae]|uniref:HlyD family secretion protein n=1 Tax=Arachidicoccus rhizosphaerae TaxID=551991 RepID=A0A1H4BHJ0_9BACT|nr:efflux RND transporter periplasmic adaptor subunit [Arachidicoccus rhizosphaerae]SEA47600.1 HlyD family secretion protein [Arachidicoccus rhizosphaerae]